MRSFVLSCLWGAAWFPIATKLGFSISDFNYWLILAFGSTFIIFTVRD